MTRISAVTGALLLLAAALHPAAAQQRNPLLVASEPGRLRIPLCQLRVSGKAEDAQRDLRKGIEERDAAKRAEALAKAEATLVEGAGRDADNPAVWYYLGRTYLAQGDVAGADSAFTRVEQMVPDCELDISQYRQDAWRTLANAGIEARQQGQAEEAMRQFRDASTLYGGLPHVFENMGVIFANAGMDDSAAIYFGKAMEVAEGDTALADNRNSAAMNRALMLQRLGKHEEAAELLATYQTWNPADVDAKRMRATSLRALGRDEEANALERELAEQFAAMNLDSLALDDLLAVGVTYFNNDEYLNAAAIFERAVKRSPANRDAIFNLAFALAMASDSDPDSGAGASIEETRLRLTAASKQLLAIEPLNEDTYRFAARGYRDRSQDSLALAAAQLMALPVNVEVTQLGIRRAGATWTGTATGRAATNAGGAPIAPTPLTLVVEFVDEGGRVVDSAEVNIPALEAGKAIELRAEAEGANIASWRYRRK